MEHIQLAHYFVEEITERKTNNERRIEHAIASIENLLKKGWTIPLIKKELDEFKKNYPALIPNIYHIEEILGNKQPPNNLIEPDVFYYHNALRKTSAPSRMVFNEETREYERIEEPFFLEMKDVFTMEDLLEYWYESNGLRYNEHHIKQDKGRFQYLLGFYDIDEILFMIDIAQEERKRMKARPLTNAFQLEKYHEQAEEAIKQKRNVHVLQGINKVIPRKVV